MSTNVLASMSVVLSANTSKFERALAVARKDLKGFVQAGEKMANVGQQMSTYLTAPIALVGGLALRAAGNMEALEKGFKAVYKGAGDANEELKKTKELAKLPGLGLEEAIRGSVNLQAVGYSAEQARKTLAAFGNALASTGGNRDDLQEVIRQLSQVKSLGKITAENLNVIKERMPLIGKALEDAFGTSNAEQLQKMGVDVDTFVTQVTASLDKLPKVAGGINNAWENMRDVGTQALAALGMAINNNFDISGLVSKISDGLEGIVEKFNNLSPSIQKAILIVGGLVAAIGPLTFAIGAVAQALPMLTVGFAALTGPIGLTIAAVAAGVALIIANWDKIKSYFTTGEGAGVFSKLKDTAQKAFDMIKAVISRFVQVATALWNTFGGAILAYGKFVWDGLVKVISTALGILGGVFDVFKNLWEGNWKGLWDSVLNLGKLAVNALIDLVAGVALALPTLLSKVFEGLGIENAFTKNLNKGLTAIRSFVEKVKFETKDLPALLAPLPKESSSASDSSSATTPTPTFKGAGELSKTQETLQKLREEFNLATNQFAVFGQEFDVVGAKSKALESAIVSLLEQGIKPQSSLIQGLKAQLDGLNTASLDGLQTTFQQASEAIHKSLSSVALAFTPVKSALAEASIGMQNFLAEQAAMAQESVNQALQMGQMLNDAVSGMFVGVGETLGNLFSGLGDGSSAIKAFGNSVLSAVADFAGQLGKYLVALGVAKLGLDQLFKAGPAGAIAAIAAGTALVALSKVVSNFASKGPNFSGGGSVAPSVSTGGGSNGPRPSSTATQKGPQEVLFRIQGRDLVGLQASESAFLKRVGGR